MNIKQIMATILVLAFSFTGFNLSANNDTEKVIKLQVNGKTISTDVDPIVKNGRTQVPVRFVAEELGYDVKWIEESRTVEVTNKSEKLVFKINSDMATVNGKDVQLDNKVFLSSNRTFLPFRFIGESFGEKVSYDYNTHTAIIGNTTIKRNEEYIATYAVHDENDNRLVGFINNNGEIVLEAKYSYIQPIGEGLYSAAYPNSEKSGIIDIYGNELTAFQYDRIDRFDNGYAQFTIGIDDFPNEKYGMLNTKGQEVIVGKYSSLSSFSEGYFAFKNEDNTCGYVNEKGEETLLEKYTFTSSFHDNLAIVSVGDVSTGKSKDGIIDKNFKTILEPKYSRIEGFNEGLAAFVDENGKWGYLDTNGEIVIKAQYDLVLPFENGLAIVQANEKDGLIDNKGNEIVSPKYEALTKVKKNLYAFNVGGRNFHGIQGGKWGFIDESGKEIIPAKYNKAIVYGENKSDFIRVATNERVKDKEGTFELSKWGVVDVNTNQIIPCIYTSISDFENGIASFSIGEGYNNTEKYGVIDVNGTVLVQATFDYIGEFYNGFAEYAVETITPSGLGISKFGIIDKHGNIIIEAKYDDIGRFEKATPLKK